jgi:hypothetical protein
LFSLYQTLIIYSTFSTSFKKKDKTMQKQQQQQVNFEQQQVSQPHCRRVLC